MCNALAVATAVAVLALPFTARADDVPATPAPEWTFPANVALTSDYIFRGLTQTDENPALQAGIEVDHASGFYFGTWASNIRWLHKYVQAASADVEVDVYAGYRARDSDALGLDVGLYSYYYPGDYPSPGYTLPYTTEAYVALSYGIATLKYSHAFTNLFGFADTQHSGYLDLCANWEFVPTWLLNAHVGRQQVQHFDAASYTGYKLGVTKNFDSGWSLAVAWVDTDAERAVYTFPNGDFQGRSTAVATLTKTF
jgi:uncharacterized protein (TIGR02001 family)